MLPQFPLTSCDPLGTLHLALGLVVMNSTELSLRSGLKFSYLSNGVCINLVSNSYDILIAYISIIYEEHSYREALIVFFLYLPRPRNRCRNDFASRRYSFNGEYASQVKVLFLHFLVMNI